ncbi:Pyrroline-5-carboxylate reductase [Roseovarius sp. EC-HK134]|jgi:pyrroline-5-carboxylate reductase|uniref:NAD(P)-binding domain-containing protein n=1 Tax=unclassified Roseovarius TaxID=2614913 RepID=UPI00125B6F25|nr:MULTISPECIES: NAD(P)-binding domain-containing protein [unclassified Roseovarius]VVT26254.1 Pyrroline-5-carboxylate reductase [Roseovarius sp. EC-HK134]VVT26400.1 Pyrroline-5-carboxylate reductase [Roseovarius sp. EC-SD190]
MRLGFLGTGTISEAVVRALAPEGHEIAVSERNAGRAARLAGDFANVTVASNQPVVDASEVVFLGLMAELAAEVLGTLRFRADQRVVSFMAGMPLEEVAALVAPARAEAVMLPYPGIAQGGSPILALGKVAVIEALFAPANTVYSLRDRAELEAYLCAQAVLSPAVQMVRGAAEWLGGGEAFLRHLVGSSLMSGACQPMLDALNTEGGYNQRLRQHMEGAGMRAALSEGLDRLADKG